MHHPLRISDARRTAVCRRLIDLGIASAEAESWCDVWQAEASRQGIVRDGRYWDTGEAWIDAERAAGRSPFS